MHKALLYILIFFSCSNLRAQVFENASFSLADNDNKPVSWQCIGGIFKIDKDNAKTDPGCLYIYNPKDIISDCIQTTSLKPGKYKSYRLKLFIRTETRSGFAGAWVTVKDSKGNFISKEALPKASIIGRTAWKQYTIDFHGTADVAFVEAGVQLMGPGKAWFDDITIEELPGTERTISKVAEQYVGEVYNILKAQAWYADSVNLQDVYQHALELVPDATSTGDCYEAVAYLLDRLGDPRSQFYDPATTRNWWKEQKINDVEALYPTAKINDSGFVQILLPGVTTMKKDILTRYADTLHKQLLALKQSKIKGWIVDLREDVGGNATAMLAAIGPLLDNGVQGNYIRSNEKIQWNYSNGSASIDTTVIKVSKAYKPKKSNLPIAVLISDQTYGAGELIVVAFKGRKNTRFFGEKTVGATFNEKRIILSDKAMLFFTAGIMQDKNGNTYNGKINPDMHIRMIYTTDVCLQEANKWLKQQTK